MCKTVVLSILLVASFIAASAQAQAGCTNPVTDGVATSATTLLGWGVNWNAQLGEQRGSADVERTPLPLRVSSNAAPRYNKVSGGLTHTAVFETQDGRVFAAGDGSVGQLGGGPSSVGRVGTFNTIGQVLDNGQPASVLTRRASDVAAGWYHTCLLVEGPVNPQRRQIYCSGRNNRGQLGTSNITTSISLPTPIDTTRIGSATNIASIVSGPDHMVAVTTDGSLWTWGAGTKGELGNGGTTDSNVPVQILLREAVAQVRCGFRFCLARTTRNDLYGWGLNDRNQMGGATRDAIVTRPVLITSGVTLFAAGGSHAMAVIGGLLHSWGSGTMGQTAQARTISAARIEDWDVAVPTPISQFAGVNIQSIACGMKHSVVLDTCGNVYTFGSDALGQLGVGLTIGQNQNYRSMSPALVGNIGKRSLTGLRVFAGAFNSYYLGQ